jgi:hypothetical protein
MTAKTDALNARRQARRAGRAVKGAAGHPVYQLAARLGFVVRGLLYAYMGYAALLIALTRTGRNAEQSSSLVAVTHFPLGRYLLMAGIVGLGAYSLWGFIRAIYDPLHRGDDAKGVVTRLGFAWSGLSYLILMLFAVGLLTHGGSNGGDSVQKLAQRLLAAPAGVLLTYAAGLIALGAGVGQFMDSYKATFRKDMRRREMSDAEEAGADAMGRAGMVARGVVFALMGWFLILAAHQHDAHLARGFSGTFASLVASPQGRVLLLFVALGFIALGLHSLAMARWARLPDY